MPPPSVPYGPGGGRAALTAALKRPAQAMSGNIPPHPPMGQQPSARIQGQPAGPGGSSAALPQQHKKKRKLADRSLHPGVNLCF